MARVTLDVTTGPLKGSQYIFDTYDRLVFGRDSECQACLPENDGQVSRFHFALDVNPPFASVTDLGSLNGTHVNGKRIGGRDRNEEATSARARPQASVELRDKDAITAGTSTFVVHLETNCEKCGAVMAPTSPDAKQLCAVCRPKLEAAETVLGPTTDASSAQAQAQAKTRPIGAKVTPEAEGYPSRVATFVVDEKLGEGAVGAVFRGRSENGEIVAIKFLRDRRPAFVDRFKQEAREQEVLSFKKHPNVVSALTSGVADGIYYLVLEYCALGSLDAHMVDSHGKPKPLSLPEATPLMLSMLEGMAHAHGLGIIHRDIKPANIMLSAPGVTKIADLGLAKCYLESGGITSTRTVAGTPAYMPDEQWVNFKRVGPTCDVYALGVTIFEMLSGSPPRDAAGKPCKPLRAAAPSTPQPVADVIDRALALKATDRWLDAGVMLHALRSALG
jgi:hypothetical protein